MTRWLQRIQGTGVMAVGVALGEVVDDRILEALLEVQDVVGDAQLVSDVFRIVNVLTGAASTFFADSLAMIIKLERHADDLVTGFGENRGNTGAVDAAGHGDHDPALSVRFVEAEIDRTQGFLWLSGSFGRRRHGSDTVWNRDHQTVQVVAHHDLTAEAGGGFQAEGKVEHILFLIAGRLQPPGMIGIDDDMAGGAGEGAVAGPLDAEIRVPRDLHDRKASLRLDVHALTGPGDKGNPRHVRSS